MDSHKLYKLIKNILKTQLDKGTICVWRAWKVNGKNSLRVGNKSVNAALKQEWVGNFTDKRAFCSEFYLYLNELLKPGWREKLEFPTGRNDLICEFHPKFWTLIHKFGQYIKLNTHARHFPRLMYRKKKKIKPITLVKWWNWKVDLGVSMVTDLFMGLVLPQQLKGSLVTSRKARAHSPHSISCRIPH